MDRKIKAVVLAAGKGTRLQTEGCTVPKVLRIANGKPLLHYVLDSLSFVDKKDTIIVVGYKKDDVMAMFDGYDYAEQAEQLGTGHAAMSAAGNLQGYDGAVLVCCGDMPLITRETYQALLDTYFNSDCACTILTGTSDVHLSYGRILRDENGNYLRIVEEKDCTPEQYNIPELNSGVYVFSAPRLLEALKELRNENAQHEYYITDVPEILIKKGYKISVCKRNLGKEIIGVNTIEQLEDVERILKLRAATL
jgi:UDP-N-acetylglucosamine diphosphorylase/glucosamine-1-phosphate N-acetyltransferase